MNFATLGWSNRLQINPNSFSRCPIIRNASFYETRGVRATFSSFFFDISSWDSAPLISFAMTCIFKSVRLGHGGMKTNCDLLGLAVQHCRPNIGMLADSYDLFANVLHATGQVLNVVSESDII